MGPAQEYLEMTPWEISRFIEAKSKQRIMVAWDNARFNALSKTRHFPKSRDEIFKTPQKAMSPLQMMGALQGIHSKMKDKK